MDANSILVIMMFVTFIALLFTGFPIALVLGGVAIVFTVIGYLADLYLGTWTGLDFISAGMVVNRIYKLMDNWVLVAIPMFIFMGLMLARSGIAEKMMSRMQALMAKFRQDPPAKLGGIDVAQIRDYQQLTTTRADGSSQSKRALLIPAGRTATPRHPMIRLMATPPLA